jgi:hypothetical protein
MTDPTTLREALIVEALGEAAKLIRQVEALTPMLDQSCQALLQADGGLRDTLTSFASRMAAMTEHAKTLTAQHLAARADEAARRTIEQQSRAMADAARVAFGAEVGSALQRLHSALQVLVERPDRAWEQWLTHVAVAVAASAITWALTISLVPR